MYMYKYKMFNLAQQTIKTLEIVSSKMFTTFVDHKLVKYERASKESYTTCVILNTCKLKDSQPNIKYSLQQVHLSIDPHRRFLQPAMSLQKLFVCVP